MKKIILISIIAMVLTGCSNPKTYGDIIDWSEFDTDELHVLCATSKSGCYSDGSLTSNAVYNAWVKGYEKAHN